MTAIHTATPREVADWRRDLASLPPDRQDAVIRMLSKVVGTCPYCEQPVRRCDGRRLVLVGPDDDARQLAHLDCVVKR